MEKYITSSKNDEWSTPRELFEKYNNLFHFNLDPCSTNDNCLCIRHFTKKEDGLKQEWKGNIFCNPPYGRVIGQWVKKGYEAFNNGNLVVFLLPVRTDTKWFHEYILPYADIHFIKGRLKFSNSKQNAPFPSMICILDPFYHEII